MAGASRGKCPSCQTDVVILAKREGKITLIVKCRCLNHPDDVITFDLHSLMEGMEDKEEVVYIHKGNSTLN